MQISAPDFLGRQALTLAERQLLKCAASGELCDLVDPGKTAARLAELLKAEEEKEEALRRSDLVLANTARRPDTGDETAPTIRSELIRFLARGGNADHPLDPRGVQVIGARITGELNLEGCELPAPLLLWSCEIEEAVQLRDTSLNTLNLEGSRISGSDTSGSVIADGMTAKGDVFLRNGFEAQGTVLLLGADLGGDLDCDAGRFAAEGEALAADGLKTKGGVFLRNGFEAQGTVRLLDADLGGNLDCDAGRFAAEGEALVADRLKTKASVFLSSGFEAQGTVRLLSADLGGNLDCTAGRFAAQGADLGLDNIRVGGGLFLRELALRPKGMVKLTAARVGTLVDDVKSWPEPGNLILDGFRYDRIIGPTDFKTRRRWLEGQRPDQLTTDFKPQPFEQLSKVLREMGHGEDAKRVAISKRRHERAAIWYQLYRDWFVAREFRRTAIEAEHIKRADTYLWREWWKRFLSPLTLLWAAVRICLLWLFDVVIGFGYRPLWALGWSAVMIFIGFMIFSDAHRDRAMVPNNPFLLKSSWKPDGEGDPYTAFLEEVPDFQPFNALAYSIDTFVPLVNLHQEPHWIPQVERKSAWPLTRLYLWVHIAAGWIITALFAASLTGLVKKEE